MVIIKFYYSLMNLMEGGNGIIIIYVTELLHVQPKSTFMMVSENIALKFSSLYSTSMALVTSF